MNSLEAKDTIKQNIRMRAVLDALGIVASQKNIKCFAHDDKHPSMTVYDDRVHCHSCGFDEDVVGVVSKVLHLSFIDSVKWLMSRFLTGMQLDNKADYKARSKIRLQRNVNNGLKIWRDNAYNWLCIIFRATQEAKRQAPNTVCFWVACQIEGRVEYLLDTLVTGDELDWLLVYRDIGEEFSL